MSARLQKDAILVRLSETANVAQFVSFAPDLSQRFARVRGFAPDHPFGTLEAAARALLARAPDRSLNVRSFTPDDPKAREFLYGLRRIGDITAAVRRLAGLGLHTIINETVDVNDGGVSGVVLGEVLEFAPGDTPRCVDKPGTAALPRALGLRLLETVYDFRPALDYPLATRVEFSLHPLRRGYRHEHTIVWEQEEFPPADQPPQIVWPNRFSRFLGDKAYGLLVAWGLGLPVPRTRVLSRAVAPFAFGRPTGSGETWIRTCPSEQVPGRFTTRHGWMDPFRLMAREDPKGEALRAVLAQEGVEACYSGVLAADASGKLTVEGVAGQGDDFMVGRAAPAPLPADLRRSLRALYRRAARTLGPVRFEWVHDGARPWIVQLHRGPVASSGRVIFPAATEPAVYLRFEVARGIEALRRLAAEVQGTDRGILLVGEVGVTSHLGDILRRAQIPSRIEPPAGKVETEQRGR